ncbi:Os04g0607533 [Oryza sativa Japonica Group]|uniref:Os04g0607533 protein n=1 Tax=Oryza sativa subsp. japonica TaxID=39947 RepID=A0A0P0WEL5_ORYSJ|nr:Os04g0607533 [Oryza sativa Japonica Group]
MMLMIGLCDSLLPEQSRKSLHLPVKLVHASVCSSCNLSTIRDLIRTVQFRPQFSRNGYSMQVRLANGNGN